MSMKAMHRILDIIDSGFDTGKELEMLSDPTLERYKVSRRKICLIIENLIKEQMVEGIFIEGSYDDFKLIFDNPRLTFKGMDYLYKIVS